MPRNEFYARSGILSQFDAREWSGVDLYDRGANTIAMPTFTEVGEGLYDDAMVFLNGRGSESGQDFASQLETIWNAATGATPNVAITINEDDKVEISADLVFSVNAVANNAVYGFDTAGQTAVAVGPRFVLTAVNDWQRGPIFGGQIVFSVPGPAAIVVPTNGQWRQDVPSFISIASGDTLESRENSADAVTWHIDDEGRAVWSSTTNTALSWTSTTFRDALGFDGSESVIAGAGGTYTSTSTYPIAGVLIPSRPVARQNPGVAEESSSRRTMGDGWVSSCRGTFQQHTVVFYIDGPLDCKDEMSHWLRRCLPRLCNGRKVTLYQDWGDSRLAAREFDNVDAYSLTYTSEEDGFRGRIEGWVADNSGARFMEFENRYRRRIPATLLIEEAP